jgi:hypothetical protein
MSVTPRSGAGSLARVSLARWTGCSAVGGRALRLRRAVGLRRMAIPSLGTTLKASSAGLDRTYVAEPASAKRVDFGPQPPTNGHAR